MRYVLILLALAACQGDNNHDVTAPFTGPIRRFAVDRFTLPATQDDARRLGDDLNGDGFVDNALGQDIALLASEMDTPVGVTDMIAAGSLASSLTIQSDSSLDDPTAGVALFGADGEPATTVGGTLVNGIFTSNRTAHTDALGMAVLHLPVFADADISVVELDDMEIDLSPDGNGGFDAVIRGGVPPDMLGAQLVKGLNQMLAFDPADHRGLALVEDRNRDGVIELSEVSGFTEPDVEIHGHELVSLGFGVHLVPCDSGTCQTAPPADRCHDRVRDANESDVDCGGPCAPCAGGSICAVAADCATGACTNHACNQPTCGDGLLDGLETDVDCGWNCVGCATGKQCNSDKDCAASDVCANHTGAYGTCTPS